MKFQHTEDKKLSRVLSGKITHILPKFIMLKLT